MKKRKIPVLSEQNPLLQSPFSDLAVPLGKKEVTHTEQKEGKSLEERLAKIGNRLTLRKEKAHRAGKTMLVVGGFSSKISTEEIASLAKEAKVALGCGGTVAGREIELQGGRSERVKGFFESKGFHVSDCF